MNKTIVLFDGVCNLCNGVVQFIIQRDAKGVFQFASLQSDIGRQLLLKNKLAGDTINTIVLIQGDHVFTQSSAALKIGGQLGVLWLWTQFLWVFPKFFRDRVYDWVAANRYRWFGKQENCMIPKEEWKGRFL